MRRRPRSPVLRYVALGLESLGAAAVLYAVSRWSVPVAIGLAGLLVVLCAQFLGEIV